MEQGGRQFGWLGPGRIPAQLDLRALGWDLAALPADLAQAPFPLLLDDLARTIAIRSHRVRARVIVAGIADSATRAHLLALRFGEVVPPGLSLEELGERARRLAGALRALPRHRTHGPVLLDLLQREGWVGRHRLGLHPREFALLWRLAETAEEPVPPQPCSTRSGTWPTAPKPTASRSTSAASGPSWPGRACRRCCTPARPATFSPPCPEKPRQPRPKCLNCRNRSPHRRPGPPPARRDRRIAE